MNHWTTTFFQFLLQEQEKVCRRRDVFVAPGLHPRRQSSDGGWLCAKASWSLVCGDRHPGVTSTLQLGQSWPQRWGELWEKC